MTRIGALAARSKYNATRNHPPQGAANISIIAANPKGSVAILESQIGKSFIPFTGVSYPVVNNTLQEITSNVRFNSSFTPITEVNLRYGFGVTVDVSATASIKGSPEEPISIFTDAPKSGNEVNQITLSYKQPQAAEQQQPAFRNSDGFAIGIAPLASLVAPANQGFVVIPENLIREGGTLILLTQLTFQSSLTDGILTQNVKWTLNISPQDGEGEGGGEKGEK